MVVPARAPSRHQDASVYLHRLCAVWFDTASTLVAFCRASRSPHAEVDEFQQAHPPLVSFGARESAGCMSGIRSLRARHAAWSAPRAFGDSSLRLTAKWHSACTPQLASCVCVCIEISGVGATRGGTRASRMRPPTPIGSRRIRYGRGRSRGTSGRRGRGLRLGNAAYTTFEGAFNRGVLLMRECCKGRPSQFRRRREALGTDTRQTSRPSQIAADAFRTRPAILGRRSFKRPFPMLQPRSCHHAAGDERVTSPQRRRQPQPLAQLEPLVKHAIRPPPAGQTFVDACDVHFQSLRQGAGRDVTSPFRTAIQDLGVACRVERPRIQFRVS